MKFLQPSSWRLVRDKPAPHELAEGMRRREALLRTTFSDTSSFSWMRLSTPWMRWQDELPAVANSYNWRPWSSPREVSRAQSQRPRSALKIRPGQIVSEVKLDWFPDGNKEVKKLPTSDKSLAELELIWIIEQYYILNQAELCGFNCFKAYADAGSAAPPPSYLTRLI